MWKTFFGAKLNKKIGLLGGRNLVVISANGFYDPNSATNTNPERVRGRGDRGIDWAANSYGEQAVFSVVRLRSR